MLNDGSQTGDPGELPSDPQQVLAALHFQLSRDLHQHSLDLLHNLTGGPDLSNLKAHPGSNLPTAPSSYKELTGIIAGVFNLIKHSHSSIQGLLATLSERAPPPLKGSGPHPPSTNSDCPPPWFTSFTISQSKSLESLRDELNDRLDKQEAKIDILRQSSTPRSPFQDNASSAWKTPLQRSFKHSNSSGQSPFVPQSDIKIILFPGPKDGGCLSFTPEQLSTIHSTCNSQGIRVVFNEKSPTKLPFLSKPGAKIDELLKEIKSLFPNFFPEISTNKWHRIFIHKIDTTSNEMIHGKDGNYVTNWLVNELTEGGSLPPEFCNPFNIKSLSTSLSSSRGMSGHHYLRISLLVSPALYNLITRTPPLIRGSEIKINTDTLISKCFVCSKLGHNNPNCLNTPSCPFCGESNHPLQCCSHFTPNETLDNNISNFLSAGHTLKCALCKEQGFDHNHSGLQRDKCESYTKTRFRKFQLADPHIPSFSIHHFQNYFRIASKPSDTVHMSEEILMITQNGEVGKRPLDNSSITILSSPPKSPANKCQRN